MFPHLQRRHYCSVPSPSETPLLLCSLTFRDVNTALFPHLHRRHYCSVPLPSETPLLLCSLTFRDVITDLFSYFQTIIGLFPHLQRRHYCPSPLETPLLLWSLTFRDAITAPFPLLQRRHYCSVHSPLETPLLRCPHHVSLFLARDARSLTRQLINQESLSPEICSVAILRGNFAG